MAWGALPTCLDQGTVSSSYLCPAWVPLLSGSNSLQLGIEMQLESLCREAWHDPQDIVIAPLVACSMLRGPLILPVL